MDNDIRVSSLFALQSSFISYNLSLKFYITLHPIPLIRALILNTKIEGPHPKKK